MNKPLELGNDDWPSRWLVLPSWKRLHRVSAIKWDADGKIRGDGATVCGRTGFLQMPGFISRSRLPRCAHCCRATGVPQGQGSPYNQYKRKDWKEA